MKLPFIFKKRAYIPVHLPDQQCQWPSLTSCKQPDITTNSVFSSPCNEIADTPERCFSKSTSGSEVCYNYGFFKDESMETIIRGIKSSSSKRFFFEPEQSKSFSSIENKFEGEILPFKESIAVVIYSKDPYGDFKKSMQEMIESHGLKDFECLEKLLGWYLKANDHKKHGFILEAFVDMFPGSETTSSVSHSTSSFFSGEPSFSSSSNL